MTHPLMNPSEAGEYLGLSEQRLARYRLAGDGPLFLKLGRSVKYRREELDAWLATKCRHSTSDIPVAA